MPEPERSTSSATVDDDLVDLPPEAERVISDVETLKALSDPLRLRIVERMVTRVDDPWTVRELAAALGVPPTRLYHHIELLLERELIRPVERRVVSGIIETRYRIAQLSLRLDRRLFTADSDESVAVLHDVLTTVFDRTRDEIEDAIRAGLIDTAEEAEPARKLLLSKGLIRLSPRRAAELRSQLMAIVEEFERLEIDDPQPDEPGGAPIPFGTLLALYPFADDRAGELGDPQETAR
jgi:DNA-binding transcriptional ArsR family regulator